MALDLLLTGGKYPDAAFLSRVSVGLSPGVSKGFCLYGLDVPDEACSMSFM
jgi:hypothetical protein